MNNNDANNNGPAVAAGNNNNNNNIPSFLDDPGTCLNHIANRPASPDLWNMLGGTVAACLKSEDANPQLCALYLQAVAQQLAASDHNNHNHNHALLVPGVAAAAVVEAHNSNNNMELELVRAQRRNEILEVRSNVIIVWIF